MESLTDYFNFTYIFFYEGGELITFSSSYKSSSIKSGFGLFFSLVRDFTVSNKFDNLDGYFLGVDNNLYYFSSTFTSSFYFVIFYSIWIYVFVYSLGTTYIFLLL